MALKFSMLLQAVDKVSAPARRIQSAMQRIGRGAREMGRDVGRVGREAAGITRVDAAARHLARSFAIAGRAAKHWAGKAGIGSWGDVAEKAGYGMGRMIKGLGGMAFSAAKWTAAAGAAAGGLFIGDIIGTAAQFEQFEAALEGTEGSAKKAKDALQWVLNFAKDTPYEMAEVTDAFVRARQLGIDPMTGAMTSMGDAAAGNRKSLMDAVEAIADAQTKEYERLKEFGITSSTKGNQVTFSFIDKGGKSAMRTVKNDAESIRRTVLQIWDAKYAGGMVRQSKTLVGLWSNIKDALTAFQYKIAQAGWFENLKNKAAEFLATLNRWADDGTLDKWAKKISEWLEKISDKAWEFLSNPDNWDRVADALQRMGTAAKILADSIIAIANVGSKFGAVMRWMHPDWAASDATGTAPPKPPKPYQPPKWPSAPPRAPSLLVAPKPAGRRTASADSVQVGGSVVVEVKAAPGVSARVRSASSDNKAVPLVTRYGQSMGAPA